MENPVWGKVFRPFSRPHLLVEAAIGDLMNKVVPGEETFAHPSQKEQQRSPSKDSASASVGTLPTHQTSQGGDDNKGCPPNSPSEEDPSPIQGIVEDTTFYEEVNGQDQAFVAASTREKHNRWFRQAGSMSGESSLTQKGDTWSSLHAPRPTVDLAATPSDRSSITGGPTGTTVTELLSQRTDPALDSPLGRGHYATFLMSSIVGISPWDVDYPRLSEWYQRLAILVAGIGTGISLEKAWFDMTVGDVAMCLLHLQNMLLVGGVTGSLLACWGTFSQKFDEAFHRILKIRNLPGMEIGPTWDFFLGWGLWLASVILTISRFYYEANKYEGKCQTTNVLVFAISSLIVVTMCQRVILTIRCFICWVDLFCAYVVECHKDESFEVAANEWNTLRALCEATCDKMQRLILALIVIATNLSCLSVHYAIKLEYVRFLESCPALLIVLEVLRLGIIAASLTDKCDQVPTMVNSLNHPSVELLSEKKMRFVLFLEKSQVAFHFFGTKLTGKLMLKMSYVGGVTCFFMATRFIQLAENN